MRFIYSKTSDAAFNLASEEYFLKSFKENIFFLYINAPSVICGKHQNVMGEIDFDFTKKNWTSGSPSPTAQAYLQVLYDDFLDK